MSLQLPSDVEHVRTTKVFDEATVPAGLLAAHRIAPGVWGRLLVHAGLLVFRFEDEPERAQTLEAGGALVIPPGRPHRIELDGSPVAFAIEFHREKPSI
ncbi:MAG: DUF1971 domain-containing protein [Acidimicrobiia bacterium]|nr:DUF1971 domain-containing protein [Acidimicrobiia bacterium]